MSNVTHLSKTVHPILKELGFKKKSHLWNREIDTTIQVIHLQSEPSPSSSSAQVTLNLGLCAPPVWSITWGKEERDFYDETDCCPRFRVGYLLANEAPKHLDKWWTIEDGDEAVVKEVSDIIVEQCVPYLNKHSNLRAMQAVASRLAKKSAIADRIYLAVLDHLLGKAHERDAIFAQLLSGRAEGWRPRIEGILRRLGLSADRYDGFQ